MERYDVSGNQIDLYLNQVFEPLLVSLGYRLTCVSLCVTQLVYNSKKCVQITASRQYDVGAVQPVPAVVYSYYEPGLLN